MLHLDVNVHVTFKTVTNNPILLQGVALLQRCSSYEVPKLPEKH